MVASHPSISTEKVHMTRYHSLPIQPLSALPASAASPAATGCIWTVLVGRPCCLGPPLCFTCRPLATWRGVGGALPIGRLLPFLGELLRVTPSCSSCPRMVWAWSSGRADMMVVIRGVLAA